MKPFTTGVSNSNSFEGHIFIKNELAAHAKIKRGLRGPQQRVKGALIAPKTAISAIFYSFYDDAGRTITSGGPRVWDPCFRSYPWNIRKIRFKFRYFTMWQMNWKQSPWPWLYLFLETFSIYLLCNQQRSLLSAFY